VVKGWPRLSETFIAQEVAGLERRGLALVLVSLRRPTDGAVHDLHRQVSAPVHYLPEYLHEAPARVARAVWAAVARPGWWRLVAVFGRDFVRDPTRNRLRRLGQACVLAAELGDNIRWLHVHFLHTPASVTRYTALLTGRGWSFSAHAKDIWTSPAWDLREKLADAAWGVTCTRIGRDYLCSLAGTRGGGRMEESPSDGAYEINDSRTELFPRLELLYHGLDLSRFSASAHFCTADVAGAPPARDDAGVAEDRSLLKGPDAHDGRDGRDPARPVRLLSVGRAVEKKGFDLLLAALACLPADLHWRWQHIGGGERLAALKVEAVRLGLGQRIVWLGPQAQDRVLTAYRESDLFILPCRRARDGDQDGLPNVLMEAQALGLACLSTRIAAVPELIEDGQTGSLVPAEDVPALTAALTALIIDPTRRRSLGAAGRRRVHTCFAAGPALDRLACRLQDAVRAPPGIGSVRGTNANELSI